MWYLDEVERSRGLLRLTGFGSSAAAAGDRERFADGLTGIDEELSRRGA